MIPLHDDNPTEIRPVLTVTLIVLCVLAFIWQLSLEGRQEFALYAFGMIPAVLFGHAELPHGMAVVAPEVTLFTSMFLHGGWLHLIGNMLYLWIFGNNVEDAMGHPRFILFYLICGLAAALAQAIPDAQSEIPMIGASGAISGVLGAYLMLYPHARVLVAIPFGFYLHTMSLKAGWVLGFWFAMQLVSTLLNQGQQGGVAWGAHIGGFVAGVALVALFKRRDVRLFNPAHEGQNKPRW